MRTPRFLFRATLVFLAAHSFSSDDFPWTDPGRWSIATDGLSEASIRFGGGGRRTEASLDYELKGAGWRWIDVKCGPAAVWPEERPVVFSLQTESPSFLELKAVDADGSTFLYRIDLKGRDRAVSRVVLYRRDLEYAWGGDENLSNPVELHAALAGPAAKGKAHIAGLRLGAAGLKSSAQEWIDPQCHATGSGEAGRRARRLVPEDPLVLEWLKAVQDESSPEKRLLPSMEDNIAQTFNNAVVAMAFLLKGEKERGERILDFYSERTAEDNADLTLQNFFYKGEARGFYQSVLLRDGAVPAYHSPGSDRWMGDMSWLLLAYKYHEKLYGPSRYGKTAMLLKSLLISFYKPDPAGGGYVRNGWQADDSQLHAPTGHPEGNIDAYAALARCGEERYCRGIDQWLRRQTGKKNLPLDLYTWRVLAANGEGAQLLEVPDCDLRYRKTVSVRGKTATGVFHGPAPGVENIWLDGLGHMACAYYAAGDFTRGNFYSNQMDAFLKDRTISGRRTRFLPYTANSEGGYEWVDLEKGFASTAAWYIFAKNGFNPMTLTAQKAP